MFKAKTPMGKMLAYVSLFFGLLFGWYALKNIFIGIMISRYQPPAVTISSVKAKTETWQNFITAVGSLSAINGVDLASESAGTVKDIRFNSGQMVKAGDVIILLDTSLEEAELKSNQAALQLAQMNYNRDKTLYGKNVSSKAMLDEGSEALQSAEANVEASLAKIKHKTITAPFDGRLGIRQINLGEYVSPGQAMVTLQSLNPLYVNFNVPEQYLSNIYINQPVEISVNFGAGKTVQGTITAVNSKVDQSTRNVMLQATIPNNALQLYPGMFALCKVWLPAKANTVVIPQTAISYSLSGDYVFVIKDDKAYRQYVKVGERRGDDIAILDGLTAGTPVITSGQLKLQNGARVKVDNSVEL
ncbi:MAG TPA: efflux RND transporter periplasmic adaptor subunit [Gammaproteobacteria bacterium]|jgi:membrane fusion protein (multidrug efflux system)|nr:efflux RND transporter periplasmic adaptor subunit [Gammaproteobacteria bacterium]